MGHPTKLNPCRCKAWKESMPQIEAAQALEFIHGGAYTGKPFAFCPWCGKKRNKVTLYTRPPHKAPNPTGQRPPSLRP